MSLTISYDTHYSKAYWNTELEYKDAAGNKHVYQNPQLQWEGFKMIAATLSRILGKPGRMLDIGCGGGDFARYMMQSGWDAYGIDVSQYAVDHCVPEMKGRVERRDVTQLADNDNAIGTYDLITALDFLEHLYETDTDQVLSRIYDLTRRYVFFCVAVVTTPGNPLSKCPESEFIAVKGEPIPDRWEQTAISGHVNVRHWTHWAKKFKEHGFKIDWEGMYLFQMQREELEGWKRTPGWAMPTTFFLEKRR